MTGGEFPTGPVDIQARLDQWLDENTAAQKYVEKLWYIPEGEAPPPEVTHVIKLSSVASAERQLKIGLVVKPGFAQMLDALLAMLGTRPKV